MTRGSPVLVVAAVLAVWGHSSRSVAQSDDVELPGSYAVIKFGLGLGGTVGAHNDYYLLTEDDEQKRIEIVESEHTSGLETSFAGQVEYVFGLNRFFALGGLFGVRTWRSGLSSAADEGASFGLDAGAMAQARLPVSNRLEFYVSLPVALTLSLLNEYKTWTEGRHSMIGTALSVGPTYGFGLGIYGGVRFAITSGFGLLAELGYQRYAFSHEVQFKVLETLDDMGLGTDLSVDFVTEQARVSVGAFF